MTLATLEGRDWHYPPDLTDLLIDTIPRLLRSKPDVLLFFKHVGVRPELLRDLEQKVREDRDGISKFQIVRSVLQRVNERHDNDSLRQRRSIVRRVVEWEDFSTAYPEDQLAARGFVAEVQRLVNVKDSFTRIEQERQRERAERLAREKEKAEALRERDRRVDELRNELNELFVSPDSPQRRGKSLEDVLNRLFAACGMAVREAFTRLGNLGEGVVEQVDGVVEIDGHLCLVEMKWMKEPCDKGDVSQHLVRLFNRDGVYGVFISASGYTSGAVATCRESLALKTSVLMTLRDIVLALEGREDLVDLFRQRIRTAQLDLNPFVGQSP